MWRVVLLGVLFIVCAAAIGASLALRVGDRAQATGATSADWSLISSTTNPGVRFSHSLIYDGSQNRLLLFGGNSDHEVYHNDLWAYPLPGGPWQQLSPTGGPPAARRGHSAVWDPLRNQMLIFGGHYSWSGNWNDVWAYDSDDNSWTPLQGNGTPPFAGYDYSSVWDAANDRMLVFAGYQQSYIYHDELWAYSRTAETWAQLSPTGGPPAGRQGATAVWDAPNGRMLVFGGAVTSVWFNDLWAYTPGTNSWDQIYPSGGSPPPRHDAAAGWDSNLNRLLIFGGRGASGSLNDTWAYSATANTWSQLPPSGTPPGPRAEAGAAMAGSSLYMHGGADPLFDNSAGPPLQDFWVLGISKPSPTSTDTPTPTATYTPTSTPTHTPTFTPTNRPTRTPGPSLGGVAGYPDLGGGSNAGFALGGSALAALLLGAAAWRMRKVVKVS